MKTILKEFNGSIERIKNNFYFSFLALNFVNQKPFESDVILPVDISQNKMTLASINSFDSDGETEYVNSIRRQFLNDMVIVYERYSMFMIASHQNNQTRLDPATLNNHKLGARIFEQLDNIYEPDEKTFLTQIRRLRNSIVHYNSCYSATNKLDYKFGTEVFKSAGNEGQRVSIEFDNILWIYDKLIIIVVNGNTNYFKNYPIEK